MKTTNKSTVELIDHMGTDLTIVNAARVSFDKESDWCISDPVFSETNKNDWYVRSYLCEQDEKLIKFLAKGYTTNEWQEILQSLAGNSDLGEIEKMVTEVRNHSQHWSPFAHTSIQLRVSTPIFVARQLWKSHVGVSISGTEAWNEVSRRYVDDEPVFYFPDKWRKRAENVKQGSSDEEITWLDTEYWEGDIKQDAIKTIGLAYDLYSAMIDSKVAPEQARMILPQNMMTSWYWTGSLMFFHRVFKQRTDSHAQLETQEVAHQIGKICADLFPVSWKALTNDLPKV